MESETVARARAGDRAALEAVLASVAPAVHRFGLRMCKNVHDAEDVLQDTLINIATHLGEFEGALVAIELGLRAHAKRMRAKAARPEEPAAGQ